MIFCKRFTNFMFTLSWECMKGGKVWLLSALAQVYFRFMVLEKKKTEKNGDLPAPGHLG